MEAAWQWKIKVRRKKELEDEMCITGPEEGTEALVKEGNTAFVGGRTEV